MKDPRKKRQERLVIMAASGIVVFSVLVTVVANKALQKSVSPKKQYVNITFTDALYTCNRKLDKQFAGRLRSKVLDSHSSRYSNEYYEYKLFFSILIKPMQAHLEANAFFASCFVSGGSGRVTRFEVAQKTDGSPSSEVIRKNDGGRFGWPYD